eukprot:g622.t1
MSNHCLFLFIFAAFACNETLSIDVSNSNSTTVYYSINSHNRIVDDLNRERLWRGINVVYKSAPYAPRTEGWPKGTSSLDDPLAFGQDDATFLASMGFNVIRLNVMWAGVEPIENQYNQTYIEEMKKIVRFCAVVDIDVIVEFHQDCISEMFCGEGIPIWSAKNHDILFKKTGFPWPSREAYPLVGSSNFTGVYKNFKAPSEAHCRVSSGKECILAWATADTFRELYTNGRNMRDKFAAYWKFVAEQFKTEPNVIGYELFNEPGQTDTIWTIPGLTDEHYLRKFYDEIVPGIHEADPQRLVLFEPTTWSDEYPNKTHNIFRSRLDRVPGGSVWANKSVLAFHYYTWMNKGEYSDGGVTRRNYLTARSLDASKLTVGQFLTEWMLWQCGDDSEMDDYDKYFLSWTAWNYKSYIPGENEPRSPFVRNVQGSSAGLWMDGSGVNWKLAACLARTYPVNMQGHLTNFHFNDTSNVLNITLEEIGTGKDYTTDLPIVEIFVNTKALKEGMAPRYPKGVEVVTEPTGVVQWSMSPKNSQILQIWEKQSKVVMRKRHLTSTIPSTLKITVQAKE